MLVNKNFTSGDIVSIKLINGDEIIARFDSQTESDITVNKPMAITIGAQGLGLIPWMFFADSDNVTIKKQHIFVASSSKKDAATQYLQGTTGIALR